jgi:hypothetical protein
VNTLIKRKISLEDSTDRTFNSPTWGTVTATSFYINVMLVQDIDDMGMFTDIDYIELGNPVGTPPNYSDLITKLNSSGYTFPFMSGTIPQPMTGITGTNEIVLRLPSSSESTYYNYGNKPITGSTDSKIEDVKSYDLAVPFKLGFDMGVEAYTSYTNTVINGVDRVSYMGEPTIYVFDTPDDANLGTQNQIWGLQYEDYTGQTRQVTIDGTTSTIPVTNFRFIGEGWNETDVSLSALTKQEYLFGIISPPEVQSDVFIDRGITSVMDMHLRLSEIRDLGQLNRYGNGYYKLNKQ